MASRLSSARSRAGRPRRLAPLPSVANSGGVPADPCKRCGSAVPALSLAQTIQINDLLRLPGERDGRATQRLRALMRLGEDQHRAFSGGGGVARYDASPAGALGLPNDERHLRKVKALARYTKALKALPRDQRRLVEAMVSRTTEEVLSLMRANKVVCCRALDGLSASFAQNLAPTVGGSHG